MPSLLEMAIYIKSQGDVQRKILDILVEYFQVEVDILLARGKFYILVEYFHMHMCFYLVNAASMICLLKVIYKSL